MAAILPSEEILCNNLKKFPPYGIAEYARHGADIGRFFCRLDTELQTNGQSAVMLITRCCLWLKYVSMRLDRCPFSMIVPPNMA